uniref:NADH-ubiquinone oxidoreductase chain 2 n=1 Tax=Silax daleus TaxID=3230861 RepID=A0AAU8HQ57_9ECHI
MLVSLFYNFSLLLSVVLVLCLDNWFVVWACIELMTVLFVVLLGQGISPRSVEGIAKYFIIQATASSVLLLGIILRYLLCGELQIFSEYGGVSYSFILLGLFIKVAVFPNPFWFVDVVGGFDFLRSFYVIITSKLIPVYIFIIIIGNTHQIGFLLVGLSSVALGSILGINQTSIRKIVALSSVSHLGWLVIGLPYLSTSTCFFVFFCYLFMVLPILWVAGIYELNDLNNIKRVYYHPYVLLFFIVSLLSLGGFPPFVGFIYKWIIFVGIINHGGYLVCGYLILMSLISLFFYLRLCYNIYSLYWPEPKINLLGSFIININSWGVIWFGLVGSIFLLVLGIFIVGPISLGWLL